MRLLKQKHRRGCAVASVAMLTGIRYQDALPIVALGRRPRAHPRITPEAVMTALWILGRKPYGFVVRRPFNLQRLRQNAILLVDLGPTERFGHAVVWDASAKRVLDSDWKRWPTRKRRPFYENRLRYVVLVEPLKSRLPVTPHKHAIRVRRHRHPTLAQIQEATV